MPDHFDISLKNGYYEGFYLSIDNDIPWVFDNTGEKREYQKDITVLRSVLLNLVKDNGLTVVYPGWCTGYADKKGSVDDINEFIRNLRQAVKQTDTFAVYQKKKNRQKAA